MQKEEDVSPATGLQTWLPLLIHGLKKHQAGANTYQISGAITAETKAWNRIMFTSVLRLIIKEPK